MKLTFIIPTYNRVYFLEQGLNRLRSEIEMHQFTNEVEIIVGNNCSVDDTECFLNKWKLDNPNINIKIHHHKKNLGVVNNLIFLIQEAQGEFWMFYGDDDFIPKGVLPDLINHLKERSDFPVHIFNQTINRPIVKEKSISIDECASQYFYYMGNACTAANSKLSQQVINEKFNDIKETCWPQTHVYFLVGLRSNKNEPFYLHPINVYLEQNQNLNNIFNSFRYFDAAILSLLKLSYHLKEQNSSINVVNFKRGIESLRKENYMKYIFKNIFFSYKLIDTSRERKEFRELFTNALLFLSLRDKVLLSPFILGFLVPRKFYYYSYLTFYGFFKKGNESFMMKIKQAKQVVKQLRKSKEDSKKLLHSHTNYINSW